MSTGREILVVGAALAALVIALLLLFGDWFALKRHVPDLVETIKAEESFKAKAYRDSRGVLTIGYGTNLDIGITKPEAAFLLRSRIDTHRRDLARSWPPFDDQPDHVKDALTDMAYQLGVDGVVGRPLVRSSGDCAKPRPDRPAGCGFHDMLAALSRSDLAGAVVAGKNSDWYRETTKRAMRVLGALRGD